jgi:hypothetical protein
MNGLERDGQRRVENRRMPTEALATSVNAASANASPGRCASHNAHSTAMARTVARDLHLTGQRA